MTPSPTPSEGEAMLALADDYDRRSRNKDEYYESSRIEFALISKALRTAAQPSGMRESQALHALSELFKAFDSGNLQMSSPEIGEPENNIPIHPWHEEWIWNARRALSPDTPREGER